MIGGSNEGLIPKTNGALWSVAEKQLADIRFSVTELSKRDRMHKYSTHKEIGADMQVSFGLIVLNKVVKSITCKSPINSRDITE
jgi:hypothetical protein